MVVFRLNFVALWKKKGENPSLCGILNDSYKLIVCLKWWFWQLEMLIKNNCWHIRIYCFSLLAKGIWENWSPRLDFYSFLYFHQIFASVWPNSIYLQTYSLFKISNIINMSHINKNMYRETLAQIFRLDVRC